MLQNYLKISIRNLLRNKTYSAINIFGLALGLAISMLSILYVKDEWAYDQFNAKIDRIYRINSELTQAGRTIGLATAPTPFAETLKRDFPEIEESARLGKYGSQMVKSEKLAIREQKILYADSTVFDVFTLPMFAGNPKKALTDPQSVVISESMARKYFGTVDALNQTLIFDNNDVRRVTGVMRDIPPQSHFQADFLLPLYTTRDAKVNKWANHIFNTYVVLKPGSLPENVDSKFEKLVQLYMDGALRQYFNTTLAETRKQGNNFSYSLIPLSKIHLYSDKEVELSPNGSIQYFYIFLLIGLFILLIAVFNFINLTTARSAKRAREVGVRKVMGSDRSVLIFQFLSESMLTTFVAFLVGILLLYSLLPIFNELSGKQLHISGAFDLDTLVYIVSITGAIGLLAGVYPAFYLSSFKPASALKGNLKVLNTKSGLRSYLVVFQFSISVLLIVATLLINQQLNFIRSKRVGFGKEQILVVKTPQSNGSVVNTFKNEALRNPAILSGSVSGFLPVTSQRWNDMWFPAGQTDQKFSFNMQEWMVDADYIPTLDLQLIKGRNFVTGNVADEGGVIINESAAKSLGYKNPIGKTIHKSGGETATVLGVVKDFHYESLRNQIAPLGLFVSSSALGNSVEKAALEAVSFKLNSHDIPSSVAFVKNVWNKIAPGIPFEYSFLSEDFDAMYRSEERVQELFTTFAAIAILIACMGLFGLSAFSAEQRTKEIGVRKVLGASVASITTLLSKDFLKPVLIAIIIATPLAWYAIHIWLQSFAYKVDIEWWIFAFAGTLTIFTALATIGFQSIKAALRNPVESLKVE